MKGLIVQALQLKKELTHIAAKGSSCVKF
jgi:hypothetical protein